MLVCITVHEVFLDNSELHNTLERVIIWLLVNPGTPFYVPVPIFRNWRFLRPICNRCDIEIVYFLCFKLAAQIYADI